MTKKHLNIIWKTSKDYFNVLNKHSDRYKISDQYVNTIWDTKTNKALNIKEIVAILNNKA